MSTRRSFCSNAAFTLLSAKLLRAQPPRRSAASPTPAPSSHADVAAIDHDRIIAAADSYITQAPAPLTNFPARRSPGSPNDFFSEAEPETAPTTLRSGPSAAAPPTSDAPRPALFTAHSDALLNMSMQVAALTAAFLLTKEDRYAEHAALHLRAWFVDPKTRMTPALPCAALLPGTTTPRAEGILETVQLVEVAQAVSFIARTEALAETDLTAVYQWFADYLLWLGTDRTALLARDFKNHHGTSWLLQAAAYARLAPEPNAGVRKLPAQPKSIYEGPAAAPNQYIGLAELRHQYKAVTLRAQLNADGAFQHELTTSTPYRNSLFNLDMLAGICDLLSTRFETLWGYELQDGPGMRVAIAHHFPYMAHRNTWPYAADINRFTDLPIRQPSLLFCGRAYNRPEYVDLWKTLNPDPIDPVILRVFPIRQPLLWIRRVPAM